MTLKELLHGPIAQALALLPAKMESPQAEAMLLAINMQEDPLQTRHQVGGPARGLWQFELGGGVRGVLTHPATRDHALAVCRARDVTASASAVHASIERDDVLAAAFARLLLWSDSGPLPALGQADQAWRLYLRTWCPGKPHPQKWAANYAAALAAMQPPEVVTCSA